MYTVQLAVGKARYGPTLSDLLVQTESCRVAKVDKPDPRQPSVLVVNEETLDCLPMPLEPVRARGVDHAERAEEAGTRLAGRHSFCSIRQRSAAYDGAGGYGRGLAAENTQCSRESCEYRPIFPAR
jgi:hypothetical protein